VSHCTCDHCLGVARKHDAHLKLTKALERMQRQAEDALNPPEGESQHLDYLLAQVMDDAHEILDLAHEFKQAIHLQSTR